MEIILTCGVAEHPQLRKHERRTVLGFSTEPGYATYYVLLDEERRAGSETRVVSIAAGCCDISDGRLPPSWSFDHHWVQCEQRAVIRFGPHAWVAQWSEWMQRLGLGDEDAVAEAWHHATSRPTVGDG